MIKNPIGPGTSGVRPDVREELSPVATGLTRNQLAEAYDRDRLGFLLAAVESYGPVVELAPGTILIADPAAAHDVYRNSNTEFLLTKDIMRQDIEEARRGDDRLEQWMASRRTVMASTTPDVLAEHAGWLAGEVEKLCDHWLRLGSVAQVADDLEDLTTRSFTRFCFGDRPAETVPARIRELLDALYPIWSSAFEFPRALRFLPRYRRLRQAKLAAEEELRRAVTAPGSGGLTDAMLAAGYPEDTTIRALLSTSSAACGVPAAALAWALAELAWNPGIAEQAAEHDEVVARVIDESLRLWPPTWMTMRTTRAGQKCGSWIVPAGAAIMISPYVMHRVAPCFAEPDRFWPDRWAGLEVPHGAYIPFGGGPRWCVGARFATMELRTTVAHCVRRLKISLGNGNVRPDPSRTLLPSGLVLNVEPREGLVR